MSFSFTASLRTGNDAIDGEHYQLIEHLNHMAKVEKSGDYTTLSDVLLKFKEELGKHFRSEESYLARVQYPKLSSHAKHHAETLIALERLIADVQRGEPIEGGVAQICFHEFISVVLLRDMQFVNWLADHPPHRE